MTTPRLTHLQTGEKETTFMLTVDPRHADAVEAHLVSLMGLLEAASLGAGGLKGVVDRHAPAGLLLKRLRREKGESQKALGELLGLASARVSDVEQGVRELTPEQALVAAAHYGVPPETLLPGGGVTGPGPLPGDRGGPPPPLFAGHGRLRKQGAFCCPKVFHIVTF